MSCHPQLIILLTLSSLFTLTFPSPLGFQIGTIGTNSLFNDYPKIEASGLVWIPNSPLDGRNNDHVGDGLLAGADDSGRFFMINPDDDSEYYISEDLRGDYEGMAIDTSLFNHHPHFYAIDEDEYDLIRYSYTLSPPHTMNVIEECRTSLLGALPCQPIQKEGMESLTLYRESSPGIPAEFLVGLQGNGVVYRVDATGASTGPCIDITSSIGVSRDVAGSQYDPERDILYTIYGEPKRLVAAKILGSYLLGDWETSDEDYEGFTVRGDKAYIASDNEPSRIDEFVWDPAYINTAEKTFRSLSVCSFSPCGNSGGGALACSISPSSLPSNVPSTFKPSFHPSSSPTTKPTSTPTISPTLYPSVAPIPSPSSFPTKSPSITPSSLPSSSPIVCVQDMTFRVNGGLKKNCYWVAYKPKRRTKICNRDDVLGACPVSCGLCCADNPEFKFKTTNGKSKDCQWIQNQYHKRRKYCDERKKVRTSCAKTCNNCFGPIA